jgi:hypothetical protein
LKHFVPFDHPAAPRIVIKWYLPSQVAFQRRYIMILPIAHQCMIPSWSPKVISLVWPSRSISMISAIVIGGPRLYISELVELNRNSPFGPGFP